MKAIEMLEITTRFAKTYRKEANKSIHRNSHMNEIGNVEIIPQHVIDAILVDFINHVGSKHGIDYGLYTKDIK